MEDKQYVGFWDRFHAIIVTAILISLVEMTLSYIILDDFWMASVESFDRYDIIIGHIVPMILTIFLWMKFSSDPGKMLYKARIVDATSYEEPTLKQYIIRYIGYYISLLPLGLGYWWVAWDKKKQSWHDKMAHTLVVKPKTAEAKTKWYVTVYRSILSLFMLLMIIGVVFSYYIPEDKPLVKAEEVVKKDIMQLLDDGLITNEKELRYYYKSEYLSHKTDTSIVSVTSDGVCVMNLQDTNVSASGCYLYKDIGELTIEYEENIVYLYDASIYSADYRYSEAYSYYDENSTQSALYLNMTIDEEDKSEFKDTVMSLWKKKHE